ncbi:hypothetical protein V1508DRAFT_443066 [Lipomyces doorenjongii]|uniref:uncharacterized protein n=1 Tax=Lipomyces doorenjongii TaxID=383834 RepID=UPI0034CD09D7
MPRDEIQTWVIAATRGWLDTQGPLVRYMGAWVWFPLSIGAMQLLPLDFDLDDLQDMTYSALREFVAFSVVHMSGIPMFLAALLWRSRCFDRAWSHECWKVLDDDFSSRTAREIPGATRSKIAYLGIWLLVPWVLDLRTIIYRIYGIAPGLSDFARLQDGFSRASAQGKVSKSRKTFSPRCELDFGLCRL